ncbi:MAG: FAD-binding oxidoreductase [Chloroflexota bacterium]
MTKTRERSFWGWGYADEQLPADFLTSFKAMTQAFLNMPDVDEIEPPGLETLQLPSARFTLPPNLQVFCTHKTYDRASHSYGKSFRDVMRGLYGQFDNPPDYVAYPKTEADIAQLFDFCTAESVALIPYGGGSSVVGGIEPTRSPRYKGVISCDMHHFNQILSVDTEARTARIQAGIFGPALEAGLRPHGLTLRHFPQSFEFSTLGGWIATRAGGHFATVYTHIDDFVQSVRLISPQGVWQTRGLPGSGAGPDPNRMLLGSEGIFGIITEATVRLQTIPTFRAAATVRFPNEQGGIEAVRQLSQSGLFPANCRLVSPVESLVMGIGKGADTVLLLGFESHDHAQDAKLDRALAICREHGAKEQAERKEKKSGKGNTAERWKNNFLRVPYVRDKLAQMGVVIETFETAIPWNKFEAFHRNVMEQAQTAVKQNCGRGMVMWRFTHVYPDGPAPYYSIIAKGRRGEEVQQWDSIKEAVSDAIIENGGTITHHHAVGKDHRRWYEQQRDPLFGKILEQAKRSLDPHWILNPDVLITADKSR